MHINKHAQNYIKPAQNGAFTNVPYITVKLCRTRNQRFYNRVAQITEYSFAKC